MSYVKNNAAIENIILEYISNKYYQEFYNDVNNHHLNPFKPISRMTILYYCIKIEQSKPNVLTFIKEFIKTISIGELNDNVRIVPTLDNTFTLMELLIKPYEFGSVLLINERILELIINAGVNINLIKNGRTPLSRLISDYIFPHGLQQSDVNIYINSQAIHLVELLVNHGADPNILVIMEDCEEGKTTVIISLILRVILINETCIEKIDAILKIIELLLNHGARCDPELYTKFSLILSKLITLENIIRPRGLTKLAIK